MWKALRHLGVTAGARLLEPSLGVGNFFGLMPEDLLPNTRRVGVELDLITARIAQQLYPDAKIYASGFEDVTFPNNFFDIAIGNVPFGNYGVHDAAYKRQYTKSIHNYFFIKALDKTRPGGLVAFITSSYTMDSSDTSVREYLSQRAEFLGAIRLRSTTFADNAGTSVVTTLSSSANTPRAPTRSPANHGLSSRRSSSPGRGITRSRSRSTPISPRGRRRCSVLTSTRSEGGATKRSLPAT